MKRFFVTADTVQSNRAIDYHLFKKQVLASEDAQMVSGLPVNTDWLKQASEVYNISDDLNDYVIVPVKIFDSDLPNRNGVAFPKTELLKFNPEAGCVAYRSWIGKPTFQEHNNNVLRNAKGVIFDSIYRESPDLQGGLGHVILLLGYDRTKDKKLADDILAGRRNCYSMGAYSEDFISSCCGKRISEGGCSHCSLERPEFKVVDGKLAYLNVEGVTGFECSSVGTPAFTCAINSTILNKPTIR